jgi:hypothetical protein
MSTPNSRKVIIHGIHCAVLIAILFMAIWSVASSMNDIIDGIVDMAVSIRASVKYFFALMGPASPAIVVLSIGATLWSLLMNEKLYRERLLTFKFNTFSGGLYFTCALVAIVFFVNHIIQTGPAFTTMKSVMVFGIFVQVSTGGYIFGYRRKLLKLKNKTRPIDD